ncbi:MAG: hypothetical protein DMG21_19640 [Acidobacteria bacterium]|nr:MAG: hypothetical protein DMG21_19640 [Acidobacteriota bacterium]
MQCLYSARSERLPMEQLDHNPSADGCGHPSADGLLDAEVARAFFEKEIQRRNGYSPRSFHTSLMKSWRDAGSSVLSCRAPWPSGWSGRQIPEETARV